MRNAYNVWCVFFSISLVLFSSGAAKAHELDPFTYRNMQIADISGFINEDFNRHIDVVLATAMREPAMADANTTDSVAEYHISRAYLKSLGYIYDNKWERCITYNNCDNWPKIERIVVNPGESVYAAAHYNYFTENYLVPSVQVCGVKMGADKLAHMFILGFRLYNLYMEKNSGYDANALRQVCDDEEHFFQGGATAEIASYADIEANMQGLRLMQDLFNGRKYISRDPLTGTVWRSGNIDVCDYITPGFDEAFLKSEYVGERANILLDVIAKRIAHPFPLDEQLRQKILARVPTFKTTSMLLALRNIFNIAKMTFEADDPIVQLRKIQRVFMRVPQLDRRETTYNARSLLFVDPKLRSSH